jgi:hypothetical protein
MLGSVALRYCPNPEMKMARRDEGNDTLDELLSAKYGRRARTADVTSVELMVS